MNTRYSKLFREGYESFTHLKQYDLQGIFTALASRMPTLDLYYQLMISDENRHFHLFSSANCALTAQRSDSPVNAAG
ncbi:hypothetical protein DQT74_04745 [Salmonella enterica subsp. enterica serovar Montevideo]|nr:hypothetical protein [Salmonella enterica subsp. enterica serovar Montevideo]MJU54011.1 hypothetical protein [Salmonella enterica subsp. enterica serovar Montevideo]